MNYRHAYHAGNFADVLKHAALVIALELLAKKDAPFAVIDTHAGRGLYDLSGLEAAKTGEAKDGFLRLAETTGLPGALARYAGIVRAEGKARYPGSPLIAARFLRVKDRLVAIEKHPEDYKALASAMAGYKRARAVEDDGYAALKRLLPPPERRGLVLIDPPYEDPSEFRKASAALVDAHARFATGVFLFWYPAKERPARDATIGELLTAGIAPILRIELDTGGETAPAGAGRGPKLTSAGLIVLNAPFGFGEEMQRVLPFLAERLAQGKGARASIETVAE